MLVAVVPRPAVRVAVALPAGGDTGPGHQTPELRALVTTLPYMGALILLGISVSFIVVSVIILKLSILAS